jgi:hypothetical protein
MLSTGTYLLDTLLLLASIASAVVAGRAVQLRFLPDWRGPDLLLARSIVAVSSLTIWCYLLGSVGAFSKWPLAIAFIATGPIFHLLLKPKGNGFGSFGEYPAAATLGLAIGGMALLGIWLVNVRYAMRLGLTGTDPLWYHMPFAQRFFQTQSLLSVNYAEPLFQTYFYPSSGSVFHALGMVFYERDFLSIYINVIWLGLAVLAGASIGHRKGVAATSALAVMTVMAADGVLRGSAGSAMVEAPSTFFFLAACAILLRDPTGRTALVLAGLAAGLGLAFKLTIAIPVAALTVAVLVLAGKGNRVRNTAIWLVSVLATSLFWFIRNFVEAGNPLPLLKLPFFPSAGKGLQGDTMKPISAYFTDADVIFHQLPNAWLKSLGPGALVAITLAIVGSLLVIAFPPSKVWRIMGFVALATMAGYLFTPGTAAGPPGGPLRGLVLDARFIAPGLCLGLALAPISLRGLSGRWRDWSALPMAMLVVLPATRSKWWVLVHPRLPLIAAALIIIAVFTLGTSWERLGRNLRVAVIVLTALLAVVGGRKLAHDYAHGRDAGYTPSLVASGTQRIGIIGEAGTFSQYLQSGNHLQNWVEYIGVHGPNGQFGPAKTCAQTRERINAGHYTYVIGSPKRNIWIRTTFPNPAVKWIASDPNAKFVKEIPGLKLNASSTGSKEPDKFQVFRIVGPLNPKTCP